MRLGKYKHYKGNVYDVICVGKHTETDEELVVYKSDESVWVRPKSMFEEVVELADGRKVKRFEYVKVEN